MSDETKTPDPMIDDQFVRMSIDIPQAALEQIARAIPAVDMAHIFLQAMMMDKEVSEKLVAALLLGFQGPNADRLRTAFKDTVGI